MIKFLEDHLEIAKWILIVVTTLIGGGSAGGMAWHHNKYHGHDKAAVHTVHQDQEERGKP